MKLSGKASLKVHYRPADNLVDKELVDYFLRLVRYFKNWMDLLR